MERGCGRALSVLKGVSSKTLQCFESDLRAVMAISAPWEGQDASYEGRCLFLLQEECAINQGGRVIESLSQADPTVFAPWSGLRVYRLVRVRLMESS